MVSLYEESRRAARQNAKQPVTRRHVEVLASLSQYTVVILLQRRKLWGGVRDTRGGISTGDFWVRESPELHSKYIFPERRPFPGRGDESESLSAWRASRKKKNAQPHRRCTARLQMRTQCF